jgi:cytochrome c peroxidase
MQILNKLIFLPLLISVSFAQSNQENLYYKYELGRMLFFDKVLSGNKNISCASCHHPGFGSSDNLALGIGEGGQGLGNQRTTGYGKDAIHERVPRNSPAIFNLGHRDIKFLFHDGRVRFDHRYPSGIISPAKQALPEGLDGLLAAQAHFPVQSATEMAGQPGENPIADAAAIGDLAGPKGVWNLIAQRLRSLGGYINLFQKAYPESVLKIDDIDYTKAANAIGHFEDHAFKSYKTKFDFGYPLSEKEIRGANIFYGKAKCSQCHSGELFTDQNFHSIAIPPIGNGKGDGYMGRDDYGFARETGRLSDIYKFRTPSLRNVTRTAPYGHNGAYSSLAEMIKHHANPRKALFEYDPVKQKVQLPYRADLNEFDFILLQNQEVLEAIANSCNIGFLDINDNDIDDIISFLYTLEEINFDQKFLDLVPSNVPSGLPVE